MSAEPSENNFVAYPPPIDDSIPLIHLLGFAAHKTYHELFTMSELLQNRPNIERKKELIIFACRTRQLFIRILAVVRWAESADTAIACQSIENVLKDHTRLLQETSDFFASLARERLAFARLPNLPIADSIDVLTLGRVNFLSKRFEELDTISPPATESERQEIMPRLQQIIMSKISTSNLPHEFTDATIKNGILILSVRNEFQVSLGISNADLSSSWNVLKIEISIHDPEEPEQQLIHPIQNETLTNVVQHLLSNAEKPLSELYNYLHYFCQSLRLQIFMEQAHRLRSQGANHKDLVISTYIPCKKFNIEYWKEFCHITQNHAKKKQTTQDKTRDIGMSIVCDEDGKLSIIHWPPLPIDDSVAILNLLKKHDVTMEEILNRTIYARCQRRFEDLKQTIIPHATGNVEIHTHIPALVCELVPDSDSQELLFISITPYSGLFRAVCHMESHYTQKIEQTLNNELNTLVESINSLKIWLLHQRISPLIAHLNCRVHVRLPSLNMKNAMMTPFMKNSLFIELNHNEGFYIMIHVSDLQQMLLQYYLLITEKRSSQHESLLIQQQYPTTTTTEEGGKWILEPLLIYSLDTSAFLRRELIDLEQSFRSSHTILKTNENDKTTPNENSNKRISSVPVASIKLLVKLILYYDEMLTLTQLKEEFQRKKAICKNIMYSHWTGIPYLDLVRNSSASEYLSQDENLMAYVNEEFWPRIQRCTVRLTYENRENRIPDQQWTFQLIPDGKNFFQTFAIQTPFSATMICNNLSTRFYSKTVDHLLNELRMVFELTQMLDDYAICLNESPDLDTISEITSFNFFSFLIRYGPNLSFAVSLRQSQKQSNKQNSNGSLDQRIDLRFTTLSQSLFYNAHQVINRKLMMFLIEKRSLKQFVRLLHMTSISLSTVVRMFGFNRPISLLNPGDSLQLSFAFIPYTESRWRLIFGQTFSLDIQVCGPDLILIRDGSYEVNLNESLPELLPIPGLKEFLATYADDQGLSIEFYHITEPFRDEEFSFDSPMSTPPEDEQMDVDDYNDNNDPSSSSQTTDLSSFLTSSGSDAVVQNAFSQSQSDAEVINNSSSHGNNLSSTESLSTMDPYEFFTATPQHDQTVQQSQTSDSDPVYDLLPTEKDTSNKKEEEEEEEEEHTNVKPSSSGQGYHRYLLSKSQYPVYLTQKSFVEMFYIRNNRQWSKFESFIMPSFLVKRFNRIVLQVPENNRTIRPILNETDSYRIDHLYLQLSFSFDSHLLTYRIRVVSLPDANSPMNCFWSTEELQTMETYFSDNLFPPLKLSSSNTPLVKRISGRRFQSLNLAMITFTKTLASSQARLIKDLIKIIQMEHNSESHHLWRVRWCLAMPEDDKDASNIQGIIPHADKNSSLLLFEFRSKKNKTGSNKGSSKFLVPLLYNSLRDQTTLWDQSHRCFPSGRVDEYEQIKEILNSPRETTNKNPCSLYPSINDLLIRLNIGY